MTIEIYSSEEFNRFGYSTSKTFEHIPNNFWGLYISQGSTSTGKRVRLCRAVVYYSKVELVTVTIFEDDPFFIHLQEIRKVRNSEPTQETVKLAEELMKYSFKKMLSEPNFGLKIGFLCDSLYRAGIDNGREYIQTEIKKLLHINS